MKRQAWLSYCAMLALEDTMTDDMQQLFSVHRVPIPDLTEASH